MAFLDFIKNRNAIQQQPANKSPDQKPETAREIYTRQSAQEREGQKGFDQLPPDQQAKVEAIKARLEKATQHMGETAHAPANAPADNMGSREAVRQNQTGQDRTAPALSPTSAQAGQPSTEKNTQAPVNEPPAKSPEKPAGRAQTLPRPRPSWER